jgi:hypothetical protein
MNDGVSRMDCSAALVVDTLGMSASQIQKVEGALSSASSQFCQPVLIMK